MDLLSTTKRVSPLKCELKRINRNYICCANNKFFVWNICILINYLWLVPERESGWNRETLIGFLKALLNLKYSWQHVSQDPWLQKSKIQHVSRIPDSMWTGLIPDSMLTGSPTDHERDPWQHVSRIPDRMWAEFLTAHEQDSWQDSLQHLSRIPDSMWSRFLTASDQDCATLDTSQEIT